MALYRQLHTSFWQDTFVLTLTPEEKFFYIYILTNSKTKQCGIYELPIRIAELETGYNRETVEKLLKKFVTYDRVRFDWATSEIAIKNWVKYNPDSNPKIKACVTKEMGSIKNRELIEYVYGEDTLCIPYAYPMDRVSQEEEKNKNKIKEEEPKAKLSRPTIHEVIAHFEEKGHPAESDRFYNYYESNGWKVGKNPMKNWRAAAANWIKNINTYATDKKRIGKTDYRAAAAQHDYSAFGNLTIGEVFGDGRQG